MENKSKKQQMFDKMSNRKKEVKVSRRIVFLIAFVVLLALFYGGFKAYNYVLDSLQPMDKNATEQITVEIPLGSGVTKISQILEENGIINDARIFKYYAKFKNESQFQAGNYTLTQAMTVDEIIESLKTGKVYREPVFALTVPEGLTLEQIAEQIAKNTNFTAEQFMEKVTDETFIETLKGQYPTLLTDEIDNENIRYKLEGYLFPATYPFYEEKDVVTLDTLIRTMVAQTNILVTEYSTAIAERQMTPHQFLTFASLLEEEATASTDRETIASVFYNRMAIDMPLQTDPTVLYALGAHKDRVLYEDLEVDNPYNTYKNVGLPPGPIAGAGRASMEATLNPAVTKEKYLYFLADKDGNNHFATTYEQHLANISKYLR